MFLRNPRGCSLVVWMDPEVQMMPMGLLLPPSFHFVYLHSPIGVLPVTERWPMGIYRPVIALKLEKNENLALKFHQRARED